MTDPLVLEISRVAPGLTDRDFEDLARLSIPQLAELMQFYVDAGKVSDRGAWEKIGRVLQAAEPYVALGGAILSVATGVWGVAAILK